MKVGTTFPIVVEGFKVGEAVVESTDGDTATLVIPALRVTMGLATSLTDLEVEEPSVEHVITGVDRPTGLNPEDVSDVSLRNMDLDSSAVDKDE